MPAEHCARRPAPRLGCGRGPRHDRSTDDCGANFRCRRRCSPWSVKLAERLRVELGLDRLPDAPAPPVQSTSLEAAAAYREGRERLLVGRLRRAPPHAFERAVAADPEFAAALEGLSEAYQALGYHDKAVSAAETAAAALGSARTRLALAAAGASRASARRARGGGEGLRASWCGAIPNDTEALLDLAAAQASQGAVAEAVATLEEGHGARPERCPGLVPAGQEHDPGGRRAQGRHRSTSFARWR